MAGRLEIVSQICHAKYKGNHWHTADFQDFKHINKSTIEFSLCDFSIPFYKERIEDYLPLIFSAFLFSKY